MSSYMRLCIYIYTLIVIVIALIIGYLIGYGILKYNPIFLLSVFGFLATFVLRMLILHLTVSVDDEN